MYGLSIYNLHNTGMLAFKDKSGCPHVILNPLEVLLHIRLRLYDFLMFMYLFVLCSEIHT